MANQSIEYDAQGLAIQTVLDAWASASPRNGIARMVPNLKQLFLQSAMNSDSLRILIAFGGTKPRSAFSVQNVLRREDCIWKIAVTKGDALSSDRGDFLVTATSTSKAFLREIAEIRNLCIGIENISAEWPNDYDDIQPLQLGDLVMSGYMITFSVAHDFAFNNSTETDQDPQ